MTPYLSDKIKVISLIAITMVIYIHTYYTEGEKYALFLSLQEFLGGVGLSGIANPLFYFTSGYLFFISIKTIKDCFPKIKKRIRTLFIPYVLANTIAFIMYVMLDTISRTMPSLYNVVNFHILDWFSFDIGNILYRIYWKPVAFQLWFVRDMLIFVFSTPFVFPILKFVTKKKWSTIMTIGLLLFIYFITCKQVLWMAIGGLVSMSNIIDISSFKVTRTRNVVMYICGIIFLCFVLANIFGKIKTGYGYALFGVISFWILYDKIVKGKILCNNNTLSQACSYSFFIYLIHEPTLLIFKKLPLVVCQNETMLILYFMTIPIIFVTTTIFVGSVLRKHFPKAFLIYTGGR